MSGQKTESLVPATAAEMDNAKDSFTLLCWNVFESKGNTDYRKAAMLKEMSILPPRDLVFLQEMSARPDGEKENKYLPYKAVEYCGRYCRQVPYVPGVYYIQVPYYGPGMYYTQVPYYGPGMFAVNYTQEPYYGVHYTQEDTGNKYNLILYNTEKFEEEPDYRTVLLEAYCSLQWQVDCFKQWQEMEEERVKLERERETLEMEKEKQEEKLQQDEGNNEVHQRVDSLKKKLGKKQKKLEDIEHDMQLADGQTWGKLPEKVADKYTEEKMTEGVQYIESIMSKCRPSDKTHIKISESDRKTITGITCNCKFSSRKSKINVLDNCLLRESVREKPIRKDWGSDFWTSLLKDVTYRFALTCLTYRKDDRNVIIAVSFHNRKNQPKEMLHVLLYLLREFRKLMKAQYSGKRFHIVLAGDFNTDLFFFHPDTKEREYIDYLLKDYSPKPYKLTGRRHHRIDHILLWPDHATLTLGPVVPYIIDIPHTVSESDVILEDDDDYWSGVYPNPSTNERGKLARRMKFAKLVSNHDPLTTTIEITTVKTEPKETTDQPNHGHSKKEQKKRSTKKEGCSNEEGFNM